MKIILRPNESIQSAVKRFKKITKEVLRDLKRREERWTKR